LEEEVPYQNQIVNMGKETPSHNMKCGTMSSSVSSLLKFPALGENVGACK
jgi:hypothetical protein